MLPSIDVLAIVSTASHKGMDAKARMEAAMHDGTPTDRAAYDKAMADIGDAYDPLTKVMNDAITRDDTEELQTLLRLIPSAFHRAEIRGHLLRTGRTP
jgi:hypothetical protein